MDWETLPEFQATPPDWKAFKAALFRDYPDAQEPEPSSVELDKFIEEHSHRNILSLSDFASFNRRFRRITYCLLASNCVCLLEVQKAYTKSIHPELRQLIHIYLVTEKVPHIRGEPYTVEQVREAAEYIFKGSDPCFEIIGQLQNSTKTPQPFSATEKPAERQRTTQSLQDMSSLVAEEVEKGLTGALTHILSRAPDLTPMPAPVTVLPPAHPLKPSVVQCRQPEDRPAINQTKPLVQSDTSVRAPQMSTHPPASLFSAYSTSCLSNGPNQSVRRLAAPPPSISCPPVLAALPCVLEPHSGTPASHPNILAINRTLSTQATSHTPQEMAVHVLNGLLDIFIWKLEAEVIACSGHPQSHPPAPGCPLSHSLPCPQHSTV